MRQISSVIGIGLTAGLLALGGAEAANGDIIESRFESVSPGRTIVYSIDAGRRYYYTSAGMFNWNRVGGDYSGPGAAEQYSSFCIELSQYIRYGHTYSFETRAVEDSPQPGAGMGADRAGRLSELFGRYFDEGFDAVEAAAFQTAVWEITHDEGMSLESGDFRLRDRDATFDQAQSWLTSIDGTGPQAELLVQSHSGAQDHVFLVPAPASFAAIGLACMAIGRRRRRDGAEIA
ncbi:MAG: hypothetical protein ACF8PN_14055 [Phycisphaerales bacterium]